MSEAYERFCDEGYSPLRYIRRVADGAKSCCLFAVTQDSSFAIMDELNRLADENARLREAIRSCSGFLHAEIAQWREDVAQSEGVIAGLETMVSALDAAMNAGGEQK